MSSDALIWSFLMEKGGKFQVLEHKVIPILKQEALYFSLRGNEARGD